MSFLHDDLGSLNGGELVEVILSSHANVRLMDNSNFASYLQHRQHCYYGGYATQSPFRIQVPSAGHWHLAIELEGHTRSARASIRVITE